MEGEAFEAFAWHSGLQKSDLDAHADVPHNIIEPDAKSLEAFKKQQHWLDNINFQRENHEDACRNLGIANSNMPRIPGMHLGALLKPWHSVAIQALLESYDAPYLHGGFLADAMGLGKTWEIIGFLLAKANRDDAAGQAAATPQPSLILAPPSVLPQWTREIKRVMADLDIYIYHGEKTSSTLAPGVKFISKLDQNHTIFDGSKKRHHTVVVSTYQSFARRHSPSSQDTWHHENQVDSSTCKMLSNMLDCAWPGSLHDCFDIVVGNKGHKLKNENAKVSRAVSWLNARFNLISTGTSIANSMTDMAGHSPLVFNNNNAWSEAHLSQLEVNNRLNPFALSDDEPTAILQLTHQALDQYVLGPGVDSMVSGHQLGKIYKKCLIKRSYLSRMPFNNTETIGQSIPPSHIRVLDTRFTDEQQKKYDELYQILYHQLMKPLPGGLVVWNMGAFHKLSLLTTWLRFEYMGDLIKAKDLKASVKLAMEKKLVHSWLKAIEKKKPGFKVPEPDNYFEQLVCLLQGSPKLQVLLPLIFKEVLIQKKKSIIWCLFPGQQIYILAALQLAGIDAHVLGSHLTNVERDSLVQSFTNNKTNTMVLITLFSLNSDSLNLQSECRNCHLLDIPWSDTVREQAICRIQHLGQTQIVKVYDIRVQNSFNVRQITINLAKRFPAMIAELDDRVFPLHFWNRGATWIWESGFGSRTALWLN